MNPNLIRKTLFRSRQDVLFTPEALRESATALLSMAEREAPGAWAESIVTTFPLQLIQIDFDGAGGILFNQSSTAHATGRALLAELRRQAPARVRVGTWKREGEIG